MTDTTKGEKHLTPLQPSPAYDGLPLQNEQQREPIVSLGQRTKGLPKLIKKTRDRLGTSEAATTSLLGRGQRGKGAQKHNALHRKLLVSLVVVSVLVASTVLISRKRSEVGAQIRSSAKALLAKLGCSSVHSSSGRGRTATSHGGRRLGGTSPEVDPSAQLEIECATALGLSRVDGDRTDVPACIDCFSSIERRPSLLPPHIVAVGTGSVTPFIPSDSLGGDLHLIQDTSVGEIAETLALSLKKPREDIILLLDELLDLSPEMSVVEVAAHLRGFEGNVPALQDYLLEFKQLRSLEARELERCAHRGLGFSELSGRDREQAAQKLGLSEVAPAFSVGAEQLGDPLTVLNVKADGNCFFRAISAILTGTQSQHWKVRQSLVGWMKENFYYSPLGEMLLSTDDLRRQELLERGSDAARGSRVVVPFRSQSVDRLTREQLLDIRIFRMEHFTLGTYATDVEMQGLAELLGVNICTFIPYEVRSARLESSKGIWEVRSPLTPPGSERSPRERPSIYLYLHQQNHFQVVTQVTPPFHNILLNSHLRGLAAGERERRSH